jgi:UDP-glucuronate decarboxylase
MHPNDGRVVSNFITQALKGDEITTYGTDEQTRSLCYVDDLIEAMTLMMETDVNFPGPVNIGHPGEFTIKELAEKVIHLTNSKCRIVFCPLPDDDPKKRQPDIRLAKDRLHWEPKVNLDDGLKETIGYFRRTL